jgi:hypothetical protein
LREVPTGLASPSEKRLTHAETSTQGTPNIKYMTWHSKPNAKRIQIVLLLLFIPGQISCSGICFHEIKIYTHTMGIGIVREQRPISHLEVDSRSINVNLRSKKIEYCTGQTNLKFKLPLSHPVDVELEKLRHTLDGTREKMQQ